MYIVGYINVRLFREKTPMVGLLRRKISYGRSSYVGSSHRRILLQENLIWEVSFEGTSIWKVYFEGKSHMGDLL